MALDSISRSLFFGTDDWSDAWVTEDLNFHPNNNLPATNGSESPYSSSGASESDSDSSSFEELVAALAYGGSGEDGTMQNNLTSCFRSDLGSEFVPKYESKIDKVTAQQRRNREHARHTRFKKKSFVKRLAYSQKRLSISKTCLESGTLVNHLKARLQSEINQHSQLQKLLEVLFTSPTHPRDCILSVLNQHNIFLSSPTLFSESSVNGSVLLSDMHSLLSGIQQNQVSVNLEFELQKNKKSVMIDDDGLTMLCFAVSLSASGCMSEKLNAICISKAVNGGLEHDDDDKTQSVEIKLILDTGDWVDKIGRFVSRVDDAEVTTTMKRKYIDDDDMKMMNNKNNNHQVGFALKRKCI